MPNFIKILISLAVLAVVALLHFVFRQSLSPAVPAFVIPALGSVMILALWLFPETGKKER